MAAKLLSRILNLQTRIKKMSHDVFRFKKFAIHHDRCAMKVGTDGVLLGAWGSVGGKRVLDIGTGTGLIALMAAQRNTEADVLGIDIDAAAVRQAQENASASPFGSRTVCLLQDVLTYEPDSVFDAILCNPPFFVEDTLPTDVGRALARNNKSLPFDRLIPKVASLLSDGGRFSLIVPSAVSGEVVGLCMEADLHLIRRCLVRTVIHKMPRRTLLTFSNQAVSVADEEELCLSNPDGSRSEPYQELTKDFYL